MMNFGGDYFADYGIAAANAANGYDSRYPGAWENKKLYMRKAEYEEGKACV